MAWLLPVINGVLYFALFTVHQFFTSWYFLYYTLKTRFLLPLCFSSFLRRVADGVRPICRFHTFLESATLLWDTYCMWLKANTWFLDGTCFAVESIMMTKMPLRVNVWFSAHDVDVTSRPYSYLLRCCQQATHVVASLRPASRQPPNAPLPLPPTETGKVVDPIKANWQVAISGTQSRRPPTNSPIGAGRRSWKDSKWQWVVICSFAHLSDAQLFHCVNMMKVNKINYAHELLPFEAIT